MYECTSMRVFTECACGSIDYLEMISLGSKSSGRQRAECSQLMLFVAIFICTGHIYK